MKIHKRQVEIGLTSIPLGATTLGNIIQGRIDKLSVVSDTNVVENHSKLRKSLFKLKSEGKFRIRKKKDGTDCYKKSVTIRFKDAPKAYLKIDYAPRERLGRDEKFGTGGKVHKRGFIRMELSPQHFGPERVSELFDWLAHPERLGQRIYNVLERAWITRLDFAIDIYDFWLKEAYFHVKGARIGRVFNNGNDFQGKRIGGFRSKRHVQAYDKLKVGPGIVLPPFDKDGLVDVDLSVVPHRQFLRIEPRWKPAPGHLLKWLTDDQRCPNLIRDLCVLKRELILDWRLPMEFRKAIEKVTIVQALNQLSGSEKEKRSKRRKINRVLADYEWPLFDHEAVWNGWSGCLAKLGILAQPQYWSRKNRERVQKIRQRT